MKACNKCGETKAPEDFAVDRSTKTGLHRWCKACWATHYELNRERYLAQSASFRARNPEYDREYQKRNREKIAAREVERYRTVPGVADKARAKNLARRHANLDAHRERERAKDLALREELHDRYVVRGWTKRSPLRVSDIPAPLIEAKRAQMKVQREIKERMK